MLYCFRVGITCYATLRLDSEDTPKLNDMTEVELQNYAKQVIVDADKEGTLDVILDPDKEIDMEPQDVHVEEIYYV